MTRVSQRIAKLEATRPGNGVRYVVSNRPLSDEEREASLTDALDDGHEMNRPLTEEEWQATFCMGEGLPN